MTHDITVSVLFLGAGAANSGLPVQSPSKHRKGTETNRYLAKGDFGSYSVLWILPESAWPESITRMLRQEANRFTSAWTTPRNVSCVSRSPNGRSAVECGAWHTRGGWALGPIANKYHEGKVKRTLKRELKVPEIAEREANGTSASWQDWCVPEWAARARARAPARPVRAPAAPSFGSLYCIVLYYIVYSI